MREKEGGMHGGGAVGRRNRAHPGPGASHWDPRTGGTQLLPPDRGSQTMTATLTLKSQESGQKGRPQYTALSSARGKCTSFQRGEDRFIKERCCSYRPATWGHKLDPHPTPQRKQMTAGRKLQVKFKLIKNTRNKRASVSRRDRLF